MTTILEYTDAPESSGTPYFIQAGINSGAS